MEIIILFFTPLIATALLFILGRIKVMVKIISLIAASVELCASLVAAFRITHIHELHLGSFFSLNAFSILILLTISIIGFFVTIHSISYLEWERKKGMIGFSRIKEYFILLNLFVLFMFIALMSESPLIMWTAIEATTLSTVFLISIFNRNGDVEAAWKYLIINSIGLLLGLLGVFIFLSQGNGFIFSWSDLFSQHAHISPLIAKFAFVFIFIGYGTKMGIVPLHTWKPDAYNKAPLPIVALLSGALLSVAFFAILRFSSLVDLVAGQAFTHGLFIFFGTISVILAGFTIYTQTNYKRLLAYHSIEHAGIMMLGMGFGGIGVFGALLHMVYYALSKALLALASSNIALRYSSSEIKNISGMVKALPVTSLLYAVGFFVLMGIPPSGIFFSEFYILLAGFNHNVWIALILLAIIVLVFVGFVQHFLDMFFGEVPEGIVIGEKSVMQFIPVMILTIIILLLGFVAPVILGPLLSQSVIILKGVMP